MPNSVACWQPVSVVPLASRYHCGMPDFVPAAVKHPVPFSVLDSIDIRLGTIERVDDVPESKKLVNLTVRFGDHTRSILAGLKAERPDLLALVGRQALFVVNLEPSKWRARSPRGCSSTSGTPMA